MAGLSTNYRQDARTYTAFCACECDYAYAPGLCSLSAIDQAITQYTVAKYVLRTATVSG